MSAHKIYCYDPQRGAVTDFLLSLGVVITFDVPHAVIDTGELSGLSHINFIVVDGHPTPLPQEMWGILKRDGAIVIHVDDQFYRDLQRERFKRCNPIVTVRHYDYKQELIDHHPII